MISRGGAIIARVSSVVRPSSLDDLFASRYHTLRPHTHTHTHTVHAQYTLRLSDQTTRKANRFSNRIIVHSKLVAVGLALHGSVMAMVRESDRWSSISNDLVTQRHGR